MITREQKVEPSSNAEHKTEAEGNDIPWCEAQKPDPKLGSAL
jgi:hypothetical protein